MRIIVVGCGKIGTTVIASLLAEGHDVVAIDMNPQMIQEITNIYDAIGVCGMATDCNTLREAGVEKTNLFVSVTGSDEVNMLACFFARKMGARHSIARIRNPEYGEQSASFFKQHLNLSMYVNPDYLAAQELFHILKLPGAVNIETFSRRDFEMVEFRLGADSSLDGCSLMEMRQRFNDKFLVGVVQRGDEVYIPDGSFVLRGGDRIGITASSYEVIKLAKKMGLYKKQAKNIMIIGASRTAFYLAKMLVAGGSNVKIIEQNKEKCDEIGESLDGAVIINGDGAKQEMLLEEGLGNMDAFVSLTGMDEENILLSYFAKDAGVSKVIAKVNRPEFAVMADKLGLDCIVSPKKIIADIFVRYARALRNSLGSKVETLYQLMDGRAEAIEFITQSDFKYFDIPIKDMQLKPGILISGIIRGRKIIIPSGDDRIQPGDRIVVLSAQARMTDLSDIMK